MSHKFTSNLNGIEQSQSLLPGDSMVVNGTVIESGRIKRFRLTIDWPDADHLTVHAETMQHPDPETVKENLI